jgi:hypothetical protein
VGRAHGEDMCSGRQAGRVCVASKRCAAARFGPSVSCAVGHLYSGGVAIPYVPPGSGASLYVQITRTRGN